MGVAAPSWAGELSSWQFNRTQNLLEFTTNEGVQPRAQLVPDPTRLVIDLPGTTIGDTPTSQVVGGAIQQVRIAQYDANTTRIVVELAPGYVIDPQQIQFRGISSMEWIVQIPTPQLSGATTGGMTRSTTGGTAESPASLAPSPSPAIAAGTSSSSPSFNTVTPAPTLANPPFSGSSAASVVTPPSPTAVAPSLDSSLTQIDGIRVTDDGLFVPISGARPESMRVDRSRDRQSITFEIENAVLSPQFAQQDLPLDRVGIERMEFKQTAQRPPSVEITLHVDRNSPNWDTSVSGLGGIVLLPQGPTAVATRSTERESRRSERRSRRQQSSGRSNSQTGQVTASTSSLASPAVVSPAVASQPASQPVPSQPVPSEPVTATIQGVELDVSGTQLLIQSDRPVGYSGRWQSGMYQVVLSPARLAAQVTGPQLDANSPLLRVRLRQDNADTVVITIQPAAGVRFGALNAVTSQLLALDMQRAAPSPTVAPSASGTLARATASAGSNANVTLPRVPNGRLVVVIDPGHGGPDVGAVGIGDIHEADIVLAISRQVGALLQQQGIQVIMTRSDDIDLDLEPRVQMAEQANATLFVSIHANSMGMDRPDVNGTETYYYSSGEALAAVIQNSIVSNLGVNDRGVKQARFYVLRRTSMPAVLVETGYVTGSEDAPRLADANFQTQMARAIAQGILTYLQQNTTTIR